MFDQKPLDFTDLDGAVGALRTLLGCKTGAAGLFTEAVGRAEFAAGATEDIIGFDGAYGAGDILKSQFTNEFGRSRVGRAFFGAGRIVAEQAAISFGDGLRQIEALAHLPEVYGVIHD